MTVDNGDSNRSNPSVDRRLASATSTAWGLMLVVASFLLQVSAGLLVLNRSGSGFRSPADLVLHFAYAVGAVGAGLAAVGRGREGGTKPLFACAACFAIAALVVTTKLMYTPLVILQHRPVVSNLFNPFAWQMLADATLLMGLVGIFFAIGKPFRSQIFGLIILCIGLAGFSFIRGEEHGSVFGAVVGLVAVVQLALIVPLWQTRNELVGYRGSESERAIQSRRVAHGLIGVDLVLILALAGLGRFKSKASPPTKEWHQENSIAWAYKVDYPDFPKLGSLPPKREGTHYTAGRDGNQFRLMVLELPIDDDPQILDRLLAESVIAAGGDVTAAESATPVEAEGYPGREVRLTLQNGERIRLRVYVARYRQYVVETRSAADVPFDHPDIERFFKSFKPDRVLNEASARWRRERAGMPASPEPKPE